MSRWDYASLVSPERQRTLLNAPSFDDIALCIAHTMRVLCCHSDPCDEAAGYERTVFCIGIDKELFDQFFNSWNGYRAQYFRTAENGKIMNTAFIGALQTNLVSATSGSEADVPLLTTSLRALSAKAWLAEVGKGFCSDCEGEWSIPDNGAAEILNDRWEFSEEPYGRNGSKPLSSQSFGFWAGS